jgi:YYY domain-containing protein
MDNAPGCVREDPGPITEFPYFTFLYGDLHAHLLALPVTLLALSVALALARGGGLTPLWMAVREGSFGERLRGALRQDVVWLVALGGLTVGVLRAINTWDFPTYLLVIVGAGLLAEYHALRGTWALDALKWAAVRVVALAAGVYVIAAVAIQPYQAHYALFYTGVEPVKLHTTLAQYLTVLGFFLFAVGSVLVQQTWALRRRVLPLLAATPLLEQAGTVQGFWSPPRQNGNGWPRLSWGTLAGYGLFAWLLIALLLLWRGHAVPALVALFLLLVVWLVPWHRQRPDRLLLFGMIALSLALTAAVEFVALKGDVGRMNTVFKFYLQVWVMLGLASAIGAVWLLRRWRWRVPAWRWWSVAAAILLACVLIYPVQATPVKLSYRFNPLPPTDDGMAYMQTAVYHDRDRAIPLNADYQAIRWMQDNIPGSPVILEANTGLYKWGSRVSILTGLPSVVGWDWHQRQQRGDFAGMVSDRVTDVQRMYDTIQPGELLPLLRKYHVEYVYVGPLERAYYSEAGLRKFDDLLNVALDLVYDQDGVKIYRVREGAISFQPSAVSRQPSAVSRQPSADR